MNVTLFSRFLNSRIALIALVAALAFVAALAGAGLDGSPVYAQTAVDYDDDDDGLIDIRTLAQLNAVRWDMDGNGAVASGNAAAYLAAFPNRVTAAGGRMGCPSGSCAGYELRAHLDFDTDGDGATYTGTGASAASDSGDAYHNGGAGWERIGRFGSRFATTFKGNGYVISNLFIRRTGSNDYGLFGAVAANGRVESVGLHNAYVYGQDYVGSLVGTNYGTVAASWSKGYVRGRQFVGGLVGYNRGASGQVPDIIASYSRAQVVSTHALNARAGGLVGQSDASVSNSARITGSYATGAVSGSSTTSLGGLVGYTVRTTVTNSYWDTATSGRSTSGGGTGQTTANLQSPTGYTGIYANWNVDVDGVSGGDDPWDFGTGSDYPILKYDGMDPAHQRGDYDLDDDGLIDVRNLAQLNAVRHDLDGDGDAAHADYNAAFLGRDTTSGGRMGCPSGTCNGYELVADLDFDTDGDGATYSGTGVNANGDDGDAYYNGGAGWAPIGSSQAVTFTSTFKGNGYVISNLFIKRTTTNNVGLFGSTSSAARIETVGVIDAYVYAQNTVGIIAGISKGKIVASWSTGYVRGGRRVGGMVGRNVSAGSVRAEIIAGYSHADVVATASADARAGGLIGDHSLDTPPAPIAAASYSTGTVTGTATGIGGLIGDRSSGMGTAPDSYWDTTTSGRTTSEVGTGKTTDELQAPTGYTGIYENWNVDLDGDGDADDPWDFRGASGYPVLKYGGMDPEDQRFGDYDVDGDGLIEITALDQLNAIRHDLDGNGDSTDNDYAAAFTDRITTAAARMGCPAGACVGYELFANLDFDTDEDGATYTGTGASATSDDGDAYHNGGSGWLPIGDDSGNRFAATFKGNGFTISNLFIKRASTNDVGLFGGIDGGARVESLGVENAYVIANDYVGILAGTNYGVVSASWSDGAVLASRFAGGLVGYVISSDPSHQGAITASHSRASVRAVPSGGSNAYAGGLTGAVEDSAEITASYSTGEVTSTVAGYIGGLNGFTQGSGATIAASYWDATTSGIADDADSDSPEGKTTAELQTVLSYAGIYNNWNVDVDGAAGNGDPWDFGEAGEYPALKFAGMDVERQRAGDYDRDGDGLIEIRTLAQLDAVRHDLNGNGDATQDAYAAAFPGRSTVPSSRMGCAAGACGGYELAADLDFDTDGDGATYTGTGASATSDSGDAYHNGGAGWLPIGSASSRFEATFKGNGYVISNMFVRRTSTRYQALFGATAGAARIESVGVANAYVAGDREVAVLVGENRGTITSSWTSGAVRGGYFAGGLVGENTNLASGEVGEIIACYSQAAVHSTRPSGDAWAAGLVGSSEGNVILGTRSRITASYSTGAVTSASGIGEIEGLVVAGRVTVTSSYWDTNTSGKGSYSLISGGHKTTVELQTPTGYTGIYANWNVDLDGDGVGDDPWDFGGAGAYPALKYGGMDPADQRAGDYDQDGDGLIEIRTLDQLNAVRWDLDGDGLRDSVSAANWALYNAAFADADAGMGCIDTADADTDPGPCVGYELLANLDFDTDGDGATYTGTGANAAGDAGDAYYNGGNGWLPIGIGTAGSRFASTFKGNGYVISNLFIKRTSTDNVGLFGAIDAGARIESLGVSDVFVHANQLVGALVGSAYGAVSASWSDGYVRGEQYVGGLVAYLISVSSSQASITASYSHASAHSVPASGSLAQVGGLVGATSALISPANTAITASYSTGAPTSTVSGRVGGLVGHTFGALVTYTASHWDSGSSGVTTSGGGTARTTAALQTPTDYTGIYSAWNVNVDGNTGNDDPWDFGTAGEYPALKFAGMDVEFQRRGDHDRDGDGLIEIRSLAQLNAVRWDADGDGEQDSVSAADWKKHAAAFPDAAPGFGCPDTADTGTAPGPCVGYELLANLDFDTDGDGATYTGLGADAAGDPDDAYYNGGAGWQPLPAYSATFKGNGYLVSNLFIKRTDSRDVGLFGGTAESGRIESMSVPDAFVHGDRFVGILSGYNSGTITASWTSGEVRAVRSVGGLVGNQYNDGTGSAADIIACYSHANVHSSRPAGNFAYAAGLVGVSSEHANASIVASYSTGTVTAVSSTAVGGLVYVDTASTITNSYWDTATSGRTSGGGGTGQTTAQLQAPTDYSGIYSAWNVNVDGATGNDDPWDFGGADDYPVLDFGGMDVDFQRRGDYDTDDDGLIEISNLAQLNAVRWDLDGEGDQDSVSAADWRKYSLAFPGLSPALGCPDTAADTDANPGPCLGYELAANLDFDTDGDGSSYTGTGDKTIGDAGDTYYDDGAGWLPLGDDAGNRFAATFRGNDYVISNLFIKRASTDNAALVGSTDGGARVESLGVRDAYVYGNQYVGTHVGTNYGVVSDSWSVGAVRGAQYVGGLVGYSVSSSASEEGAIIAAYSRASVRAVPASGSNAHAGGLAGAVSGDAEITAAYAAGAVSSTVSGRIGGLIGHADGGGATITHSYWDTTTSGRSTSGGGAGKTSAELKAPTEYAGIYSRWNVDTDGDNLPDDPWYFGTEGAYPVLKFGDMDPWIQYGDGDYDRDDDGLIEIFTLARLNAVRWDMDGDGAQDSVSAADWQKYSAAFPDAAPSLGCPDTDDADTNPGPCLGYELVNDLDFDTDGDGSTYTGTGSSATSDSGDAYHNGGAGWAQIGSDTSGDRYAATFRGNGYVISNLFIKRTSANDVGLFGAVAGGGRVESVGVSNAYVNADRYVGVLVGNNYGVVAASWSSGSVLAKLAGGGLVGYLESIVAADEGAIIASYSHASVRVAPSSGSVAYAGGLTGGTQALFTPASVSITASYSTGAVTSTVSQRIGGLNGNTSTSTGGATYTNNYYDTTTSGRTTSAGGTGQNTAGLQNPTRYEGIYADWNVDVDGDGAADDPWDFGGAGAYPALKYGGMDPAYQRRGDYDQDGDLLIEISTLAQFDAVRHDLDGDGDVAAGAAATAYNAAFPERDTTASRRMGCPGTCEGYELLNDLDFDTDGDGATYTGTGATATGDDGDAYYNGGAGFTGLGGSTAGFSAAFKGNGYTISNLFINQSTVVGVGMFAHTTAAARIESVGVEDAYVYGGNAVGILAGDNYATITSSYTTGEVGGVQFNVGGLVGAQREGEVTASYSTASVWGAPAVTHLGGMFGYINSAATVSASYSTGSVMTTGTGTNRAGFAGEVQNGATVKASYWDSTTSGVADDSDTFAPEGKPTAELQSVLSYTGIYENWNVDVDGVAGADDPWIFGLATDYPVLKAGGMDPYRQYGDGDYDRDGDGLIEITGIDRLNAVRWDLDGDGAQGSTSDADWRMYEKAFPDAIANLGCSGACSGYELAGNLNLASHPNWEPIGDSTNGYSADFAGNGNAITNLTITRTEDVDDVGLFGRVSSGGVITGVGLEDVTVTTSGAGTSLYVGALAGHFSGTARAVYATGSVSQTGTGTGGYIGGLAGYLPSGGTIAASRSSASVTAAGEDANAGGLIGRLDGGTLRAAYATGAVSASGDDAYAGGLAGVTHMGTVDAVYAANPVTAAGTGGTASGVGATITGSNPTITAAYWDTDASGIADDADTDMPEGKTIIELQTPAGYTGIFANWNVNVDGAGGADDPWDFGGAFVYPVLKYGGMDVAYQRAGDFDQDGDGLIEIRTLAQLDAIRWDRDGQGDRDTESLANWQKYNAAFANADLGMGCIDTDDAGTAPGPCVGYELVNDLDFDTNGNGYTYTGTGNDAVGDSGDAYNNGGSGWQPIGNDAGNGQFHSTFKGNGYTISNLFIKRTSTDDVGLFGAVSNASRVESLGMRNAYVYGEDYVGVLVGDNYGVIAASWSSGEVRAQRYAGGLTGYIEGIGANLGHVIASYSRASVARAAGTGESMGGLVGIGVGSDTRIVASYATGTVTTTHANRGGLLGSGGNVQITASYWDTTISGISGGKTAAQLQAPIRYAGIYAAWNRDLDGDGGADDPWDFGMRGEYPALKYGGMDPAAQRQGDYDKDADGLIEISTLAQLDAVREDLNGNGDATVPSYAAAFPNRETRTGALMGCPGTCVGYELTTHLDFDTDGDGSTYTGTGADAVGDSGDQFYNGGSGWDPIGNDSGHRFAATFKGNGYVISNMFIKRATENDVGLFGAIDSGDRVESLGVADAYVNANVYVGIIAGNNYGLLAASWTSGGVWGDAIVGGAVGQNVGDIFAGYSTATVHAAASSSSIASVGGLAGSTTIPSSVIASYSAGEVTTPPGKTNIGGLIGAVSVDATIADSYWNTTTSGITSGGGGEGKTAAELQAPKTYAGVFANWNVNVDRRADSDDDPWDFGGSTDYPVLKYGGMGKYTQRGDYDTDDDGLIEITTLEQLNAMRWDLNGNAVRDSTSAADWKRHNAAFHNAIAGFGCAGSCRGYELASHLTFDGDARYSNWTPVGDSTTAFSAAFDGNGYIIHNLKIDAEGGALGLFGATAGGSSITGVGLTDVYIRTTSVDDSTRVGALIGSHGGTLRQSYATGSVAQGGAGTGGDYGGLIGSALGSSGVYASWADVYVFPLADGVDAGGFVGSALSGSTIRASYAKGSVVAPGDNAYAAAFAGAAEGTVGAAYASGISTATGTGGTAAGFHARGASPTLTAVYWDATTSNLADDADSDAPEGVTTANLQSPTDYAGIYADWNDGTLGNVDGRGGADDPWDFGEDDQYPALKFGVQDPYVQRGDYDVDDDGLIEITTLDRLNAIRWDLDGDGAQDATTAADWHRYNLAFPNAAAGMGCPDTAADADSDPGPCVGYELAANLDFDVNGDGAVDSKDPYPVWMPLGSKSPESYSASFAGNGMTVSNLTINSGRLTVGLFKTLRLTETESVTGLGLPDANVTSRGAYTGTLAGRVVTGTTAGAIRYSWATGDVTHVGTVAGSVVGGLIGRAGGGALAASWADVDVSSSAPAAQVGGLVGLSAAVSITASYAAGDVSATGASAEAGGLTGRAAGATILASYSTGAAASTGLGGVSGGFAGSVSVTASALTTTAITDSYWDTATSGVPDDRDTFSPEGVTTANLQTPTGYDGIYAAWNVDVDATTGADDPWDFGAPNQYPILDVGDMDTTIQPRAADGTPAITAPVQVEIPCAWVAHPSALNRCP